MKPLPEERRTWAEININAAEQNYKLIKNALPQGTKLCCVVKANAYGHSAAILAPLYESLGADWFAVSNIHEALDLRGYGITRPVLILGFTPPQAAPILAKNNISQCVYSLPFAEDLSREAQKNNVRVKIHIKIDSGMGRIGFKSLGKESGEFNEMLCACRLPALDTEGIFTHFASADEGESGCGYTQGQFSNFNAAIKFLEREHIKFSVRHCSNSAAITDFPAYTLDMVRAGIILYGLNPSSDIKNALPLTPVMTLKSVISHIKNAQKGECISYGRTFTVQKDMRIATIAAGYADGILRSCGTNGLKVLIRGHLCPVIGRICMDQFMADITAIPDAQIYDEVMIFGNKPAMTASEIAIINGTINYEVVCAVGERVPRIAG
ncbi:MAG: alanine racemase [Synergistes sp.]|nr:alanine racemase [Synergistes sp.]